MTDNITTQAVAENTPAPDTTVPDTTPTADTEVSYIDFVTSDKHKQEHEDYVAQLVEMGIRRYTESGEGTEPSPMEKAAVADDPGLEQNVRLHMKRVKRGAEETARLYPEFDLRREMRDPLFLKLTVATGGDTTAAYVARHYDEIISGRVRDAEKRGAEAVAASVRSGGGRPKEGALSKGGAVVEKRDPAKLSLGDFKRIRENFRKTGKRERF